MVRKSNKKSSSSRKLARKRVLEGALSHDMRAFPQVEKAVRDAEKIGSARFLQYADPTSGLHFVHPDAQSRDCSMATQKVVSTINPVLLPGSGAKAEIIVCQHPSYPFWVSVQDVAADSDNFTGAWPLGSYTRGEDHKNLRDLGMSGFAEGNASGPAYSEFVVPCLMRPATQQSIPLHGAILNRDVAQTPATAVMMTRCSMTNNLSSDLGPVGIPCVADGTNDCVVLTVRGHLVGSNAGMSTVTSGLSVTTADITGALTTTSSNTMVADGLGGLMKVVLPSNAAMITDVSFTNASAYSYSLESLCVEYEHISTGQHFSTSVVSGLFQPVVLPDMIVVQGFSGQARCVAATLLLSNTTEEQNRNGTIHIAPFDDGTWWTEMGRTSVHSLPSSDNYLGLNGATGAFVALAPGAEVPWVNMESVPIFKEGAVRIVIESSGTYLNNYRATFSVGVEFTTTSDIFTRFPADHDQNFLNALETISQSSGLLIACENPKHLDAILNAVRNGGKKWAEIGPVVTDKVASVMDMVPPLAKYSKGFRGLGNITSKLASLLF